jgi:hypothetical protein
MKYMSYKETYTDPNDIWIYWASTNHMLCIGLSINLKTSGQGQYVQPPLNTQGFEQSTAAQAMNNRYHCKPISMPPPQGSQVCTAY